MFRGRHSRHNTPPRTRERDSAIKDSAIKDPERADERLTTDRTTDRDRDRGVTSLGGPNKAKAMAKLLAQVRIEYTQHALFVSVWLVYRATYDSQSLPTTPNHSQ